MPVQTIVGFVTVRASSSRLPGKCLLPFGDGNVLDHVIRRAAFFGIEPIVCTSADPSDDVIERIASRNGVKSFRGSLLNKLKRWADCATFFGVKCFHTIDADDPFFDGLEIERSISLLLSEGLDVVSPSESSSSGGASVGYSLKADIVNRASASVSAETDTEMMWYYLEKIQDRRSVVLPDRYPPPPTMRLTLDYEEDYWLLESVRKMVGNLAPRNTIDQLFARNPDLHKINWFRNAEWKAAQLGKKI